VDASVVVPFDGAEGNTVVCDSDCVRPGGGGAAVVFVVVVAVLSAWAVVVVFAGRLVVGASVVLVSGAGVAAGLAGRGC
jgi:hypothetical protein